MTAASSVVWLVAAATFMEGATCPSGRPVSAFVTSSSTRMISLF